MVPKAQPDPSPSAARRDELTLLPERTSLPRGLRALPEAEVAASQRGRILQAVTEEVAERGYAATSVKGIIGRARVSRAAFYAAFSDRESAFAAAHLEASQQLLDRISAAAGRAPAGDWRARHRAGVTAYLRGFQSAPAYAVSFMVEIRAAGPRLADQRDEVLERHAHSLAAVARQARREQGRPPLSRAAIVGLTGATDELATREIRAGRIDRLHELVDPIMELNLAALTGTREDRARPP